MGILKLEVEGFRSFRKMTWEPGSLNVVIGPNACGKSNLLGLLEMLSEAAKGRLREYVLRQGGMTALLWDGRADQVLTRLLVKAEQNEFMTETTDQIDYSVSLSPSDVLALYSVNNEVLNVFRRGSNSDAGKRERVLETADAANIRRFDSEELVYVAARQSGHQLLLNALGGDCLDYPEMYYLHSLLTSWYLHHYFPTTPDAPVRLAQVARYETELDPDGQNLTAFLHTLYESDSNFREQVNDAMNAAFGGDFEELVFPPAADQRVQMRIRWKGLKQAQSAAVLSDGTLRFLFLVAVLANPKPPALIAIDEPETGLHPNMLPILAEYAVEAASRTQLIFTSHSPEFLNAFSDTVPTTTVMQWKDGQTEVRVLEGESLAYWLDKYQLGELYRDRQLEAMG
jgi:predicted ATPase